MQCDAVMFDLDGTLVDTLPDIHVAANDALTRLGRPTIDARTCRRFVGRGATWLFEQALGPEWTHLAERGATMLKTYYAEHGSRHAAPYPGIAELLEALERRGLVLAVLSNKPHPAAREVVDTFFGGRHFATVQGQTDALPLKPDPTAAHWIADRLAIAAGRWLYVGDSEVDMQTASAAGMFGVGVTWGFRDRAELVAAGARSLIDTPGELLGMID